MIRTVLKTIAAAGLALSANMASATTLEQMTFDYIAPGPTIVNVPSPAVVNGEAGARFDIGGTGVDGFVLGSTSVQGYITDFDFTFTIPAELRLTTVFDPIAPSDAGLITTTDGLIGTNNFGVGSVNVITGLGGLTSSVRLEGFVAGSLGIDLLNLVFQTTSAGTFEVGFSGTYTYFSDAIGNTVTSALQTGTGFIRVVDPNVIPLPAGGVLLLTGAGALIALRRRKRAA